MQVIDILKDEHQTILSRLEIFKEINSSNVIDKKSELQEHLDFFENYADHFHHAKEEEILFKWMITKNPMMENGPIAVMLSDHNFGRSLLNEIADLLTDLSESDDCAKGKISSNIESFYSMLVSHISKEDNMLYEFAKNMDAQTGGSGDEEMMPSFNEVNDKLLSGVAKFL